MTPELSAEAKRFIMHLTTLKLNVSADEMPAIIALVNEIRQAMSAPIPDKEKTDG